MRLSSGARLGPYEVVELLGAGGMGEVYRARDPRLGRDVALKVLPEEVAQDAQRLSFFEREARAVATLNHPNILTVHDVGTHEGAPYVVTELLEGENLRELVSRRTPTVRQILGYALQAARGLEAAHAKDIVHRDLKPENLFLTTDGRVKVLDFGLAKLVRREQMATDAPTPSRSTAADRVVGTVAYMSPEQARGRPVDARSDVFSFGVVLYELLAGRHPFKKDTAAATLTAIVEETPAALEGLGRGIPPAVGGIVQRCLEKEREDRYGAGHDVAMVLDAVLAAPPEAVSLLEVEERSPYPGLSSFMEKDAGVFFGREREVEELWGRIRGRKLLAVIGPSGVGKTSFVRAGIMASRPEGWAAVHATPGSNPTLALARALTPELAGDAEAIGELLTGLEELRQTGETERVASAVKRWRSQHAEALFVFDQFEELFTLNPPETQARVAVLLKRLASEADVHIVLSMRDDFLIRCSDHEPLAPVFSEITPLTALTRDGLRRAVVEPAKKQGYRFEDESLVEEMVSTVEGVRGALPLLAFAVARLWEKRDRERKLLTREAYQEIAGVEGALAQHAEATMDRIGPERQATVREIFRNLVTAQGTRAVIDRGELLSAFPDRPVAEDALRQLIDARLLTSYEVEDAVRHPERGFPGDRARNLDDVPSDPSPALASSSHRIEIVHESLLKAWPRLVRWQAQDEEGAVLRDQLKQAAHLWEEKGRTPDLLWSGTAFREYELWRERYGGALTALEEGFATAMVERARRRKRIRRGAVAAAFLVLAGVAATIAVSRQHAVQSALRAEASHLVTLGRSVLEADRTEALAYAIASLERADTAGGRRLVLRALWSGPPATVLPDLPTPGPGPINPMRHSPCGLAISPDGRHIAAGYRDGVLRVFPRYGGAPVTLQGFDRDQGYIWTLSFSSDGRLLVGSALGSGGEVRVWETEGWQLERVLQSPERPKPIPEMPGATLAYGLVEPDLSSVLTVTFVFRREEEPSQTDELGLWAVRRWPLVGGSSELVGEVEGDLSNFAILHLSRRLLVAGIGDELHLHRLDRLGEVPPRVVGRHIAGRDYGGRAFDLKGERLAACDGGGTLRVWPLDGSDTEPERELEVASECPFGTAFSPDDSLLAQAASNWGSRLWDLRGPAFAEPLRLGVEATASLEVAFTPDARWLVTTSGGIQRYRLALWPLSDRYPRVLRWPEGVLHSLLFHPDGSRLLTAMAGKEGSYTLLSWPLTGGAGREPAALFHGKDLWSYAVDPQWRLLFVGSGSVVRRIPLDGGVPSPVEGFGGSTLELAPTGRYLAGGSSREANTIVVLDLETGERLELEAPGDGPVDSRHFDRSGRLLVSRGGVLSRWDPKTRATEVLLDEGAPAIEPIGDGDLVYIGWEGTGVRTILNVEDGTRTPLPQAHQPPSYVVFGPTGSIVASGHDGGEVRVGRLFEEEYQLLLGPEVGLPSLAVSPDGRWIASSGSGGTVRLWPMPDLSKRPFHTLPHEEFMARLRALTNLRAVPDPGSPTGYTIEPDFTAYRGWATVPTW
jgi:WD40 repeat protein